MLTNTLGAQRSGQPTSKHCWSNDLILGNMHVSVNWSLGDGLVKSLLCLCTKGGGGGDVRHFCNQNGGRWGEGGSYFVFSDLKNNNI